MPLFITWTWLFTLLEWKSSTLHLTRALSSRVVVFAILIWVSKFPKRAQRKLSKNSTLARDVSQGPLPLARCNGPFPLWHLPAGNYNSCIQRAHDILKIWRATVHTTLLAGSQCNLLKGHLFFTDFLFFFYIPSFRIWGNIMPFRVIGSPKDIPVRTFGHTIKYGMAWSGKTRSGVIKTWNDKTWSNKTWNDETWIDKTWS